MVPKLWSVDTWDPQVTVRESLRSKLYILWRCSLSFSLYWHSYWWCNSQWWVILLKLQHTSGQHHPTILHCHICTLREEEGEAALLRNVLDEAVKIISYIKSQCLSMVSLIACMVKWEVCIKPFCCFIKVQRLSWGKSHVDLLNQPHFPQNIKFTWKHGRQTTVTHIWVFHSHFLKNQQD